MSARTDRDARQKRLVSWAEQAFGRDQSASIPQRGVRLLEEAIETFQACGCDEAMAHKLVAFVFARPPGTVGQELGGVAVTTLLLAAAAGLSADEEESREIDRVLSKPVKEFTERNANKNAAGFLVGEKAADPATQRDPLIVEVPTVLTRIAGYAPVSNTCCGGSGTRMEVDGHYCASCGQELL